MEARAFVEELAASFEGEGDSAHAAQFGSGARGYVGAG